MENRLPQLDFNIKSQNKVSINSLFINLNQGDLFGIKIPHFQRELVWTEKQNVRLVESVMLNIPIGAIMVNNTGNTNIFDNILLDGQQRLTALNLYFNNKFPVNGLFWNDLNLLEQRTIRLERSLLLIEVSIYDEAKLKEVCERLNFGGTPHKQSETGEK